MKKLFLFLFFFMFTTTAYSEIMIISNKSVPSTPITKQELKDIFLGKKIFWDDKSKIIVATMTKGEVNDTFLTTYINKSAKQFDQYWEKKIFTGDKNAPIRLKTVKQMIEYVTNTSGAIGFIEAKEAPTDVNVVIVK